MHRIAVVLCIFVCSCSRPQPSPEFVIAAAADLRFAMDELVQQFKQRSSPRETIRVTYGSSGQFESQIRAGAPYDLYFSADIAYPEKLAADGYAKGNVFRYGAGRLALWVKASSTLPIERGASVLADANVKHVSIANPGHAPYGRAAVAALRSLGVYDAVQPKLVNGENVSIAWQYVNLGSADAGIIALSLAMAPNVAREGRYWEVPLSAYPRMDQGGIVVKSTDTPELAEQFRAFVLGAEGRAVLKKYGFY